MNTVTLTYVKSLPGFDRQCYKGDDGRYYVFQTGEWLSASKDWEPCCPVTNVTFRLEDNTQGGNTMPYVIKVDNGYVKSGKEDTQNIKEAKQFKTEEQAKRFATSNCAGSYYRIVDILDEKN